MNITPRTRNLYWGWTNSVYTPPGKKEWRFADISPSVGPLGMAGIAREYQRQRRNNGSTYWACAVWQNGKVVAKGVDVLGLIQEYNAEYRR